MKTYSTEELKEILQKHWEWARGEDEGQRAYLRGADLRGAYLQEADLQGADLRGADLQGTILSEINWLSYIGIVPDERGIARAYKMTNAKGEGPYNGGINYAENNAVEVDSIDTDAYNQCGHGINLATLQWCLSNKSDDSYRLFLMELSTSPDNICVPVATDGKFRVKKATKIGECDWSGNLLPAQD